MRTLLRTAALGVLLSACSSQPWVPDDFDTLALTRTSGLGFCPADGNLSSVSIERNASGRFEMRGTVLEALTEPCYDESCFATHPVAPFELDDASASRLVELVAAIPVKQCTPEPGLACDPCLIETLTVDGSEVTGGCCGEVNDDFLTAFGELLRFLDGLAEGAVPEDAGTPPSSDGGLPDAG